MAEEGSGSTSIVRIEDRGVILREMKSEPMTLEQARSILSTVVSTHEDTFTEGSDLTKIGEYDT